MWLNSHRCYHEIHVNPCNDGWNVEMPVLYNTCLCYPYILNMHSMQGHIEWLGCKAQCYEVLSNLHKCEPGITLNWILVSACSQWRELRRGVMWKCPFVYNKLCSEGMYDAVWPEGHCKITAVWIRLLWKSLIFFVGSVGTWQLF